MGCWVLSYIACPHVERIGPARWLGVSCAAHVDAILDIVLEGEVVAVWIQRPLLHQLRRIAHYQHHKISVLHAKFTMFRGRIQCGAVGGLISDAVLRQLPGAQIAREVPRQRTIKWAPRLAEPVQLR